MANKFAVMASDGRVRCFDTLSEGDMLDKYWKDEHASLIMGIPETVSNSDAIQIIEHMTVHCKTDCLGLQYIIHWDDIRNNEVILNWCDYMYTVAPCAFTPLVPSWMFPGE